MIGQTISHYRILAELGEGGMGKVYRAEDTTLRRQVALKVLRQDVAGNQERLERFQREAEILAALDHPSIVHIYSVEEAEGAHFLTMQLVEGKPLSELIPKNGMPLERIFEIAIPLADALASAHEAGVIHRDLKPGNIMVNQEGRVKVLDFGLAKAAPEAVSQETTEYLTEEGRILGTLPYMSPEQLQGKPLDTRSDLFSFGVMLFEMATGERPFKGDNSVSLMSSIVKDTPQSVSDLRTELPRHLGRILEHCLEKSPVDRFQSSRDLYNELRGLKRELTSAVTAPPSTAGYTRSLTVGSRKRLRGAAILGVFILTAVAVGFWVARQQWSPAGIRSLAVLPLDDLSGEAGHEYFVDGMTEALIADLGRMGAFRVISRQSVMRYADSTKPLPEIARELNVDAVVEGSVLRSGDRVRIIAKLIEAATDRQVWTGTYERGLGDVLELQREVARTISGEINLRVLEQARPVRQVAIDPEAHEAYLRGRYHWNKRTEEGFRTALEQFRRAVRIDPQFAAAYAGLADTYYLLGIYGLEPAKTVLPLAREAVTRALELDETQAEARVALGAILETADWDWVGAEREYRRAIASNPNYSVAHHWLGNLLVVLGRLEEGIGEIEQAKLLDPLSSPINTALADALVTAGRSEEAIGLCRGVLATDPDFAWAHNVLGQAYLEESMFDEAIEEMEEAARLAGNASDYRAELAHTYAAAGRTEEAQEVLGSLTGADVKSAAPWFEVALVYVALGDEERAFDALERAFEDRSASLPYLKTEPRLASLRSDPRFDSLLVRVGLLPER